jgi:hypothetical protein
VKTEREIENLVDSPPEKKLYEKKLYINKLKTFFATVLVI